MKKLTTSLALLFATSNGLMAAEPLLFSDLQGLGSSVDSVTKKIEKKFNATPDGFCINDNGTSGAYLYENGTTVCTNYGWWCNKTAGEVTYQDGGTNKGSSTVLGTQIVENASDEEVTQTVTVTGVKTSSTTISSSITTGLELKASFTVTGVFETGVGFNMSTTVGNSQEDSNQWRVGETVTVKVPPNSKVELEIAGTIATSTVGFSFPVELTEGCYFGANFPHRVNDHYFLHVKGKDVLKHTHGTVTGTLTNVTQIDIKAKVSEATPL